MTATTSTYAAAVAANGIMLGFDAQHTNNNPYEKVLNSANVSRLVQDWTFHTGGYIAASPVVASGVVYITSTDTHLYALDAISGKQLWTSGADEGEASPAVANGVVYIGSEDNYVYALDARSGKQLWSYKTENGIFGSPSIANGIVYVGSFDHTLYALDARLGDQLWTFREGGAIFPNSAVVANGMVYIGSYNTQILYAFHLPEATH